MGSYVAKWSDEIFIIKEVINSNPITYRIVGYIYIHERLIRVGSFVHSVKCEGVLGKCSFIHTHETSTHVDG